MSNLDSSGFGVLVENCINNAFIECTAANNGGDFLGAGFNFVQSNTCILKNCQAFGNVSFSNPTSILSSSGFLFNNCHNMVIKDCEAIGNNVLTVPNSQVGFFAINGGNNLFDL